jgi:hypothetical protein
MIYKSVYQSQTEDGESMTADTLHEDDPTTNTGVCKRVKEDSMAEEPSAGFIKWPTDAEVRAHFDDYVTAVVLEGSHTPGKIFMNAWAPSLYRW